MHIEFSKCVVAKGAAPELGDSPHGKARLRQAQRTLHHSETPDSTENVCVRTRGQEMRWLLML